jgi:hypothetical protein
MSVTVAQVRQRVAAAADSVTGYTESRFAFAQFGRDASHLQPKAFAVFASETPAAPGDRRQRPGEGMLAETTVLVKVAHVIRGDAVVADTDAATDGEHLIVKAVKAADRTGGLTIVVGRIRRAYAHDGAYLVSEIELRAVHQLALE